MSRSAPTAGAHPGVAYVVAICAVAATSGFLFGDDTAVVNGTVGALERHFSADAGRLGFAVASALLGSAVGALIAGRVAAASQWVANWLVTLTFPGLARMGLGFAYGLYTAAAALSIVLVARFVRETKGRELEDM